MHFLLLSSRTVFLTGELLCMGECAEGKLIQGVGEEGVNIMVEILGEETDRTEAEADQKPHPCFHLHHQ